MALPSDSWLESEWLLGALGLAGSALSFLAGILWRAGSRVGAVMTRITALEDWREDVEVEIKALSQGQHMIENALAALPDKIAQRFNSRFDELTTRIDRVIESRSRGHS